MAERTLDAGLAGFEFEPQQISWRAQDVMLYALGVGSKPEHELDFLYEGRGPKVLPTYAVIPGMRAMGNIAKVVELNIARLLHGEQGIEIHRPLPPQAELTMRSHISEVWDKGTAAVIGVRADFGDDDGPVFSTHSTLFYLGGGGFGGEPGPSTRDVNRPPDRPADLELRCMTREEQGALYRLSGDRVALHIDPDFARKAGYEKPFMHGLCTFGFVGRAVLQGLCEWDPERFVSIAGRFSERVEFGDEIQTQIWHTGPGEVVLQAVTQDGKVALSHGRAVFRA
ncbi:MAG: MaoC/PaaZ C-terminal domain-containing protein [Pseudomonadales bacterium]